MNTTENPCILDRTWLPTWKYQAGITFLWCAAYAVLLAFSDLFHAKWNSVCYGILLLTYLIFITGFVAPAWKNALRETLVILVFWALPLVANYVQHYFQNDFEAFSLLVGILYSSGMWAILIWSACCSFWVLPPENHIIRRTFFVSTFGMLAVCAITCAFDARKDSPMLIAIFSWFCFGLSLFMTWIVIRMERKRSAKKRKNKTKLPSVVSLRAKACVAGCLGTLSVYLFVVFWCALIIVLKTTTDSRKSVRECLESVNVSVPETAVWEKAIHAGLQDRYDCAFLTMSAEDFARIQLPKGVTWEKPTDMKEVNLIYNDQFWTPVFTEEELKRDFEAGRVWIFDVRHGNPFPAGVACFDEKEENVRVWLCNRGI
ncbi:MAG: hypothetical protein Q4C70_11890 [Planctomycetia bacterium]|nr:hypothetical protein [Planctomycetia bacterium]